MYKKIVWTDCKRSAAISCRNSKNGDALMEDPKVWVIFYEENRRSAILYIGRGGGRGGHESCFHVDAEKH
jgi:hypothetical protein